MKILRLKAENIKRLKAIEINTEGSNFIEITGKNAQGKSSIMDSIAYAIGGKKLIPERPIRDGEEEGMIKIDVGDFIIHRKFSGGKSSIKVTSKDGFTRNSPQAFLDDLVGTLSFDPVAFTEFDKSKRVDMFKKLAGIDTQEIDRQYDESYKLRTEHNSELKYKQSVMKSLEEYSEDVEALDISELQKQRDEINNQNMMIERWEAEIQKGNNSIEEADRDILELQKKIDAIIKSKEVLENELIILKSNIILREKRDVSEIDEKIKNIQPLLIRHQKHQDYLKAKEIYEHSKSISDSIQLKLDTLIASKQELIQSAKLPVDGLTLVDNELYYNNIPFEQLSQAEKLKVSMGMAIAEKPELKIVRIMDGALLDNDSMAILKEMAEVNDFQVWIETVSNDKPESNALYIEDGKIV